ncbi:hypothetical protein DFH07DRAFT_751754 [Mycena maculata]|uniref:F-box domain-containing protein n=1 Tax=Mycena maculata TaxID=230809 RepID=A0AAD7ICX7_9AGAR|nr:hypothetical protein DFH07DRAFT_751754 [Mycena maculata]
MSTYPVLTLPPEVVSEIFENFLPTYPRRPALLGIFSPLFLCRICRQWRQIAISTPTLWRAVSMELQEAEPQETEKIAWKLRLLTTWLSRSGQCPLSLYLYSRVEPGSPLTPYPILSQFLDALVLHCKRWEHVELVMPVEHLHVIRGRDMPLLRDLTFGPSAFRPGYKPPLTLFDRAPQLTNVVLTESFVPASLCLPWAQLTHLEAHCLYEDECAQILTYATNLVDCTFAVCDGAEEVPDCAVPVLPYLQRFILLHIAETWDISLARMLGNVRLPALRTLQVSELFLEPDPLSSLKTLIARSQCTLDELHIDDASLSESVYREAFQSIELTVVPS